MTTFVSVRFGNVLESSGSVVPLFKQQIAKGGPVTVISPEVRRFFMTVSEAVDLVLLVGTTGNRGDIMVLEMGECMKVLDLAHRLIELSGLIPDRDIKIEFTGLRPGEKEYEEVMTEDENVVRTSLDKIWVLNKNGNGKQGASPDLEEIETLVQNNDAQALRDLVTKYVPENRFAWNDK
jgi:FlaA1/EpsC-like NDP-sugar epimerase